MNKSQIKQVENVIELIQQLIKDAEKENAENITQAAHDYYFGKIDGYNKVIEYIRPAKMSLIKKTPKENSGSVIKLFELVNPSFAQFYKRKTQHDAAKRLLDIMSFQEIEAIVNLLPEINSNPYAKGKSISPFELEKNLGWIKASIQKDNNDKILEL